MVNDIVDNFVVPPCPENIELMYQDTALVTLSKPSKLLSLSGKNPLNKDSVHARLVKLFPTATLVHRLDFGTSGIMVAALNKQVNSQLTKQFQQRTVVKQYKAILQGHLYEDEGVIDYAIAKDNAIFPRLKICSTTGKPALTHYHVAERLDFPARSIVLFKPTTGRTHQLRIHAQAIGHPILGCDLYGCDESLRLADRLMLHALSIEFTHPLTGDPIHAQCACPF